VGELLLGRRDGSFRFGLLGLVLVEPALEEGDGGEDVVVELEREADLVEVYLAREAVGELTNSGRTGSETPVSMRFSSSADLGDSEDSRAGFGVVFPSSRYNASVCHPSNA
jgi:hypothetical protein